MPYVGFAFTDAALDFLEGLPPKIRRQIIKKAKALHTNPYPQGVKKLRNFLTDEGDPVYRERSGDYRILYVVRSLSSEIIIIDIDNRKDVYMKASTKSEPADEMRMKESDFDAIMSGALGVAPPSEEDEKPKAKKPKPKAE